MAWKTGSKGRTRNWKRPETRTHANRTFARKRKDWVTPFCTTCSMLCLEPADECPNGAKIHLIDNASLRSEFGDTLRVTRILGDLWLHPQELPISTPCAPPAAGALAWPTYMRVGLAKSKGLRVLAGAEAALNPLTCSDPGMEADVEAGPGGDFTEAGFMHTWQHTFTKHSTFTIGNSPNSCCSVQDEFTDTHWYGQVDGTSPGGTTTVPTVAGYTTHPAITCVTCGDDVPCTYAATVGDYSPWHIHFDWKRPINLRDDDGLNLWLGWERLTPCGSPTLPDRADQSILEAWGGIRLLVEK